MSRQVIARQILSALGRGSKLSCQSHVGDELYGHTIKHSSDSDKTSAGSDYAYAFEMASSTLRFGVGVTKEVGQDIHNLGLKNTLIITDDRVETTHGFQAVADSLTKNKAKFDVFDKIRIEPTDISFQEAIEYARKGGFDSFVAVGGGSTIDTAKAASLLAANPGHELWDFTALPFGKSLIPPRSMLPLIAVPTTAGTGSETTAISVFDIKGKGVKTAIRQRSVKPTLAIVDPLNVESMPRHVTVYSGFDVLCHALESYTAKPFTKLPRPSSPSNRPIYQGTNPISDVWSRQAMAIIKDFFKRAVNDPSDLEARANMMLAASFAGMGFGNAGVHLCHGLSYPISGHVKQYTSPDYDEHVPLIPHGLSVVTTASADFRFTGIACPQRHLDAAELLGVDISKAKQQDAGDILADKVQSLTRDFGVPNGLEKLGFERSDLEPLTESALKSLSALQLAPREHTKEALYQISGMPTNFKFEKSIV